MKKAIMIMGTMVIFLLSSGLASAGFTDIKVEKNVSVVAGNSDYANISFLYSSQMGNPAPLILKVNITSPETQVWKEDFQLDAFLKVRGSKEGIDMKCIEDLDEIQNKEFLTDFYKHQFPLEIPNGTFYCYNKNQFFILKPNAYHELRVNFSPNIALKPAKFNVEYDFLSIFGFPVFEPVVSTDENGVLRVPKIGLEIDSNAGENFTITTYSRIYLKPSVPSGKDKSMLYLEINPQRKGLNGTIRINYNRSKLDREDLEKPEIYRCELTRTGCKWVNDFEHGRTPNYVWAKVKHFSLYGVFASEKPNVITKTVYRGGGGTEGAGTAGGILVEGGKETTTTTTPPETPANETTTTIPTTTTTTIPETTTTVIQERGLTVTPLGRFLTNPAPGIAGIIFTLFLLLFGVRKKF